uniref:p12-11p n=1 Tax=Pyrococcus sp. 12/1 TaxID=758582 RepID=D6MY17_9EURY|nr:ribonuclease H-like domain-containing protein [Pyrococcus sp. 12/1]ADF80218.1 p12-11p [Pyrococcus sp. 12/1]
MEIKHGGRFSRLYKTVDVFREANNPIGILKISQKIKYPVGEKEAVLDLETTGLEPEWDEILSFGIAKDHEIKVYTRVFAPEEELVKILRKELRGVKRIYAYYCEFEERFLKSRRIWRREYYDLYKGKKLKDAINISFDDRISGEDVPFLWVKFQVTGEIEHLMKIAHHNLTDIYRELMLYYAWDFPKIEPQVSLL